MALFQLQHYTKDIIRYFTKDIIWYYLLKKNSTILKLFDKKYVTLLANMFTTS